MPSFQAEVDMIRSGIYNMEKVQTEPVYQVFVQLKMAGKMKEFNELYDKTWPAPAPEPAPEPTPTRGYMGSLSYVSTDAGAQASLVSAVFDTYESDPMYPLVVVNVGDDCEFFQLDETRAAIIQINSMMDYALDDEDFEGVDVSFQYDEKGGLDYQMTVTGTTKLPVPDKVPTFTEELVAKLKKENDEIKQAWLRNEKILEHYRGIMSEIEKLEEPDFFDSTPDDLVDYIKGLKGEMSVPDVD
tara:strand:- start:339 stop:1067 length:729 start_codon:yes stop_codon:yes gene_type:complete